jgi:MoaD family protein
MITVRIPTPLRPYTEGISEIQVNGKNVGEALQALTSDYPAVRNHLFTEENDLRSFVNLFLNDEDVRHLEGVQTPLREGDRLMIIPSIAGG